MGKHSSIDCLYVREGDLLHFTVQVLVIPLSCEYGMLVGAGVGHRIARQVDKGHNTVCSGGRIGFVDHRLESGTRLQTESARVRDCPCVPSVDIEEIVVRRCRLVLHPQRNRGFGRDMVLLSPSTCPL